MLYCEGEAGCERVDYWIMTNRQNTNWPDFKGETDFCGQAMSSAFGCGFNKSKAPKFDQCCKNDASATAKRLKPIVSICDNPGTDPTGGAQYFWTKNKTPKWMKEDEVRKGNCKKVTVRGCSQDIWKCKNRPIA